MLALVDGLPPESALATAIRNDTPEEMLMAHSIDPAKAPWSLVESLLAVLIDEVRNMGWMYASAHTDKSIPKPEPIARPGVRSRRLRAIPIEVAMQMDPRLRGLSPEEAQRKLNEMTGRGN